MTLRETDSELDCYAAAVLLAKAAEVDEPSPSLAAHLAECDACADLHASLAGETELVPAIDELVGQQVGPYRIEAVLGAGGMGRVYRAVHTEIESEVAIKVLSNKAIESDHLVSRFFAEARAAAVIKHENIVNVLDVGRLDDGRPFLIMEHLLGDPLSALIGGRRLTDALVRRLALDVLAALEATHAIDIVHRDLKPDNIFVSPEGRATLLDFGIAKLVPQISGRSMHTASGLILGTPHYMAPEQAAAEAVDGRADLYSMGVILYECVTGERPFDGSSFFRLASEHHHRPPRPPSVWRDDLSGDLEALILKALAKRPNDRFQSAADMRAALESCEVSGDSGAFVVDEAARKRAADSEQRTAATVSARPISTKQSVRPRRLVWLAMLAAITLAVAMTVVLMRNSRAIIAPALDAAPMTAQPNQPVGPTSVVSLDAAPPSTDAAAPDARATPIQPDASVAPVSVARKPRGRVKPLSRLAEAAQLARNVEADAVLGRIEIVGLDDVGNIRWDSHKNAVRMFFYSPSLVAKYEAKRPGKIARCGVLAVLSKGGLEVRRAQLRCGRMRPLPTPRCSVREILRRARAAKKFPPAVAPESARLRVPPTRRGTPTWMFTYKGVKYGHPSC